MVLTLYLLAVGKRWITALLAVGALALVIATLQTHGNPSDVARANLVVQGLLATFVAGAFVLSHLRNSNRQVASNGGGDSQARQ